jgi:hypothetical protein
VKRGWAWIGSSPIVATKRPSRPISQPFTGSAADEAAGQHHADDAEPEELEGAEAERGLGQHRREHGETDDAEQRARDRAGRGDAHRPSGLPLSGQRVAVEAGGGVGGGARDVEQDGGAAAAVDRADVDADEDEDGVVGRHLDGERREEGDAEGGREAGQQADDDAGERRPERQGDLRRPGERGDRDPEVAQAFHAAAPITAG